MSAMHRQVAGKAIDPEPATPARPQQRQSAPAAGAGSGRGHLASSMPRMSAPASAPKVNFVQWPYAFQCPFLVRNCLQQPGFEHMLELPGRSGFTHGRSLYKWCDTNGRVRSLGGQGREGGAGHAGRGAAVGASRWSGPQPPGPRGRRRGDAPPLSASVRAQGLLAGSLATL